MSSRCPERLLAAALALACAAPLSACKREAREFERAADAAHSSAPPGVRVGELQPGQPIAAAPVSNRYEENAAAVSQGKQLYRQFNCGGCHAQGGGSMGPALMDDSWIYGAQPANIYATIAQGRPNGMPSFGGHIPDDQIWKLVAYVRSMSGQLHSDVAPARSDKLEGGPAEASRKKETPTTSSFPKSSEH